MKGRRDTFASALKRTSDSRKIDALFYWVAFAYGVTNNGNWNAKFSQITLPYINRTYSEPLSSVESP